VDLIDFACRITVSLFLGSCIGFERQLTAHPAGIRTNMLICLGSCMFLLFPMIMNSNDIQRVASYIVSGVGFLCSGVIIKENGTVKGLNTAATLWCSSAIGVLASSGMFEYAFMATLILIISNILFRPISHNIKPLDRFNDEENFYKINIGCNQNQELNIRLFILKETQNTKLTLIELVSYDLGNKKVEIEAIYKFVGKRLDNKIEIIVNKLSSKKNIQKVSWKFVQ